jgi:hypothetical protein
VAAFTANHVMVLASALPILFFTCCSTVSVLTLHAVPTAAAEAVAAVTADHVMVLAFALPMLTFSICT